MTPLARVAWIALLVGFASQVVLGHLVAFALDGPVFAWHQDQVARALWGRAAFGPRVAAFRAWIQALLGGTMIAWAEAMLFVVAVPLRRGRPWAAWAVGVSALHWFLVDTSVSAARGVWINVAFNVAALLMVVVPLALMLPWLRARHDHASAIALPSPPDPG